MEPSAATNIAEVFISCKKEKHYGREMILPQPALVKIISGEMRIASADKVFHFFAGDTVLIPRNQLGRMSKLPLNGEPCIAVSIVFRKEILYRYYANEASADAFAEPGLITFPDHPLLESLFSSLMPYFKLADALPAELAGFKMEEAIRVLRAIDARADQVLGRLEEPGKLNLIDFMERNYMFNLPLEKFGYLTGRSLTTYKKDFRKAFKSTPGKWLTKKRLELAHYQIFEERKKPAEVYLNVGFDNLSHFSFAFKKHFGYNATAQKQ